MVTVRTLDKRETLRRILRAKEVHNAFIFCNRKKDVDILFKSLEKHGFSVVALHGDMPQSKRNEMLAKFKANEAELLVCSDVAARGLDISDVKHVINFDVPVNAEDYIHRIGRTGRAGKAGHAYTLATPGDARLLGAVEKLLKQPIPPLVLPELADLTVSPDSVDEGDTSRGRGKGRPARGGRESGRGRGREKTPRKSESVATEQPVAEQPVAEQPIEVAAEEASAQAFVAAEAVVIQDAAPEAETAAPTSESPRDSNPRERKDRPRKDRDRSRADRNSDARGAEDRARKTRRNPHGIAEMDIAENVIAFGGFTPAFLLVDPYGGKGAPPPTILDEDADEDPVDSPQESHDSATSENKMVADAPAEQASEVLPAPEQNQAEHG